MPRAWSFARVSSQQQADSGGGLERQADETLAARWCASHGYELADRLEFTGSAYKGLHLSDGAPLRAWLDQAAAGLLGDAPALLVEEVDRFTRQAAHHALAELLAVAFPAGVVIVSLRDGTEYSQAAFERDDRLLGDLLEEIRSAHRYSRRLGRRLS